MRYKYDLHVHSALSPCAENDMTPVTIVGTAKLIGLDFVAIADHNSIKHVEVALLAGEAYDVRVIPAMELQTDEDIHLLCLFPTYDRLKGFYDSVTFTDRLNREEFFGEQLIYDEDDEVIGKEPSMLLDSAKISSDQVPALVKRFDGVAIPAHIDREGNSMLKILGAVTDDFHVVELSTKATAEEIAVWSKTHKVVVDSDAHTLADMSSIGEIELEEYSVDCFLKELRSL